MLRAASYTIVEPNRAAWQPAEDRVFVERLDEVTGDFDIALICSPTALHAEQIEALAGRVRGLFIEKPLAHDRAALARIRRALEGRPVLTMVGCNYRFEPGLLRVRALLAENTVGAALSVRAEFGQWLPSWRPTTDYRQGYAARRETGGGIILDRIHELDYVSWLFGQPSRVLAMSGKLSTLDIETEDTAEVLMRFPSGAIGSVHVDYLQRQYVCSMKVICERGTIEWRFKPSSVRVLDDKGAWQTLLEDASPDVNAMYVAELEHFFGCVERSEPPINGIGEAALTQETALAALEAA
jgi:predicted dehydrogenase